MWAQARLEPAHNKDTTVSHESWARILICLLPQLMSQQVKVSSSLMGTRSSRPSFPDPLSISRVGHETETGTGLAKAPTSGGGDDVWVPGGAGRNLPQGPHTWSAEASEGQPSPPAQCHSTSWKRGHPPVPSVLQELESTTREHQPCKPLCGQQWTGTGLELPVAPKALSASFSLSRNLLSAPLWT